MNLPPRDLAELSIRSHLGHSIPPSGWSSHPVTGVIPLCCCWPGENSACCDPDAAGCCDTSTAHRTRLACLALIMRSAQFLWRCSPSCTAERRQRWEKRGAGLDATSYRMRLHCGVRAKLVARWLRLFENSFAINHFFAHGAAGRTFSLLADLDEGAPPF